MDIVDSEKQQLHVHQIETEKTSAVFKIISGYANALILWFANDEIESRWYDTQNHQFSSDRMQFVNVTSVDAKQFEANRFVAVCMNQSPNDRPSTIRGLIKIYRYVWIVHFSLFNLFLKHFGNNDVFLLFFCKP